MLLYKRSTGISMVQLWCEIASFFMVLVQKKHGDTMVSFL